MQARVLVRVLARVLAAVVSVSCVKSQLVRSAVCGSTCVRVRTAFAKLRWACRVCALFSLCRQMRSSTSRRAPGSMLCPHLTQCD